MNKLFTNISNGLYNPLPLSESKKVWAEVRKSIGLQPTTPKLLTYAEGNTKFNKSGQVGLSLLPHRLAGVGNICPYSTKGCRASCINTAGRGKMSYVQEGRKARTVLLVQHPEAFSALFMKEWMALPAGAVARLNVFSDIPWHKVWRELFEVRPDIQIHEYTKYPWQDESDLPLNLHITYSASERMQDEDIQEAVEEGHNVAVVFPIRRSHNMITSWKGMPVVDGDVSDARHEDPDGVIVGLRAKGDARKINTKFVRELT